MAKTVIKRGGKKETFKKSKLVGSIRKALREARVKGSRAKRVLSKVSRAALKFAAKRKSVRAADLRKRVLGGLRKMEPGAARAWLRYEKRRRSRGPKKSRRTNRSRKVRRSRRRR